MKSWKFIEVNSASMFMLLQSKVPLKRGGSISSAEVPYDEDGRVPAGSYECEPMGNPVVAGGKWGNWGELVVPLLPIIS